MRRFVFLLFAVFLSLMAFAQLEVKNGSFKEVPGFVNINTDKMDDDNNVPYAVVKVNTVNINDKQRHHLLFQGNAATFIELEYHVGEVWVYLSSTPATYLKISHPDFGSTEFWFPFDLKPKKGYEMVLVNKTGMIPESDVYNYLVVTTDQPNAAVYIDDVFEGEQYAQKSFMAGEKHRWRIECELYHSESGEAVIPEKEGENVTVEKKLRPAFGYLNVTSSPESGAIVYIDGKKVGMTPFTTDKLASGEHKVRVMKEMYSAIEKTFTVTDGNTTQASMTMSANFVNVTVTTDSESDIYVDNELKGKGSWSGRLSDGNHAFEARKASHRNSVENLKLTLGKNESIVIPNPTPIYGTIDISTNPIGANIIIDGKNYGTTPRVLTNVLIGTHELRLEKSGCASMAKNITLAEKNKLTISEKLQTGREIAISTDKSGDMIYVDGNYVGTSPLNATLSFGEHNVKAVRDDKESKKTVTVAPTGGDTSVQLAFSTGAGNGVFSVASNRKVNFSKGNLQYQASTNTWRFAENQYDYVGSEVVTLGEPSGTVLGSSNHLISDTYDGWIDLFDWCTNGYNGKNPWMESNESTDYGDSNNDIAGTNYDWGVYNTISNGGDKSWRILTRDEWEYVFDIRSTSSGIRYAKATVNGVNGVILLPDNWSSSNYSLSNTNKPDASFSSNCISQSDWTNKFEANGAVFLPAAGCSWATSVRYVGSRGYYWFLYSDCDCCVSSVLFDVGGINMIYWSDSDGLGFSVRLVCSAQ